MAKKNHTRQVTEREAETLLESFKTTAEAAEGTADHRGLFRGFKVVDGLWSLYNEAVDLFVDGEFSATTRKVQEAEKWLSNALRKYCGGAMEKHFELLIAELVADHEVDQDLVDRVGKRRREFEEAVRLVVSSTNASLEEASRRYWALEDAIQGVKEEQKRRKANRLARQVAEQRAEEEKRDEASRLAQAVADEKRKAERQARAEKLRRRGVSRQQVVAV
jgi:hypothetical protein